MFPAASFSTSVIIWLHITRLAAFAHKNSRQKMPRTESRTSTKHSADNLMHPMIGRQVRYYRSLTMNKVTVQDLNIGILVYMDRHNPFALVRLYPPLLIQSTRPDIPVQTPVAASSSRLAHVLPDPGKLTSATAALLLPSMKRQLPYISSAVTWPLYHNLDLSIIYVHCSSIFNLILIYSNPCL